MNDTTIGDGLDLVELALRGRWNVAAARARHFPQELTQQNEDGLTALHLAVVNNAPAHLLAAMLLQQDDDDDDDDDDAKFVQQACLTKDESSGMTPLLCAAASFAPLETMQRLVDACPEAVCVQDDFGATCLHHVCARARGGGFSSVRRALARAEILLNVQHGLVREADDTGLTPIHVLCQEFEEDMQSYWLSKEPDVQLGMLRCDVDGLELFFDTLLRYWECSPSSGNVLHRVLSIPSPPLPLVSFFCRRLPAAPLEQDSSGNTPLHIAVQGRLFDVARSLVQRFPQGASLLNDNGESALTLASRHFSCCNQCMRLIIMACPSSLEDVVDDDLLYTQVFANLLRDPSERGVCAVFDILRRRPEMIDRDALE